MTRNCLTSLFVTMTLVAISLTGHAREEKTIRLGADLTYGKGFTGRFAPERHLDTVKCVLDQLGQPYEIKTGPAKRNRADVLQNQLDGYFLQSPNRVPQELAVASRPLAIERWFMFSRKLETDEKPKLTDPVGTVLGSNEHYWLKRARFENIITVPNLSSAVKMLARGRVKHILTDESKFYHAAYRTKLSVHDFERLFMHYSPLVVHFSNKFHEKNAGYVRRFNNRIDRCVTDLLSPTAEEIYQLQVQKINLMSELFSKGELINDIIREEKTTQKLKNKSQLDNAWIAASRENRLTTLMASILDNRLSKTLAKLARDTENRISEIFIFNKEGYILGMNRPTSDYWQGDELPWLRVVIEKRPGFVSDVDYDPSTRKFLIQIFTPIFDPISGQLLAVLAIGFDAETALSNWSYQRPSLRDH